MIATQVFLQELIVNPDRLNHLVDEAKMAALQHGLVMRTHETPNSSEVRPPRRRGLSSVQWFVFCYRTLAWRPDQLLWPLMFPDYWSRNWSNRHWVDFVNNKMALIGWRTVQLHVELIYLFFCLCISWNTWRVTSYITLSWGLYFFHIEYYPTDSLVSGLGSCKCGWDSILQSHWCGKQFKIKYKRCTCWVRTDRAVSVLSYIHCLNKIQAATWILLIK